MYTKIQVLTDLQIPFETDSCDSSYCDISEAIWTYLNLFEPKYLNLEGGEKKVHWQIAVLQLFQAKFPSSTWTSFTKLKFRRLFWGAEWVCILIGSKVMTQNAIFSIFVLVGFCKKKISYVLFLVIFAFFAFLLVFHFLS